jgi:hypothetical protein
MGGIVAPAPGVLKRVEPSGQARQREKAAACKPVNPDYPSRAISRTIGR